MLIYTTTNSANSLNIHKITNPKARYVSVVHFLFYLIAIMFLLSFSLCTEVTNSSRKRTNSELPSSSTEESCFRENLDFANNPNDGILLFADHNVLYLELAFYFVYNTNLNIEIIAKDGTQLKSLDPESLKFSEHTKIVYIILCRKTPSKKYTNFSTIIQVILKILKSLKNTLGFNLIIEWTTIHEHAKLNNSDSDKKAEAFQSRLNFINYHRSFLRYTEPSCILRNFAFLGGHSIYIGTKDKRLHSFFQITQQFVHLFVILDGIISLNKDNISTRLTMHSPDISTLWNPKIVQTMGMISYNGFLHISFEETVENLETYIFLKNLIINFYHMRNTNERIREDFSFRLPTTLKHVEITFYTFTQFKQKLQNEIRSQVETASIRNIPACFNNPDKNPKTLFSFCFKTLQREAKPFFYTDNTTILAKENLVINARYDLFFRFKLITDTEPPATKRLCTREEQTLPSIPTTSSSLLDVVGLSSQDSFSSPNPYSSPIPSTSTNIDPQPIHHNSEYMHNYLHQCMYYQFYYNFYNYQNQNNP